MVGAFTEGREKYAGHAEFIANLLERADVIKDELLALVDEDSVVFENMGAAYKLPKESAADKEARRAAIQAALKACTVTPYKVMGLCVEAIDLTGQAVGRSNVNVVSDLGVAAVCLKAAAQGAWLNMLINFGGVKDAEFVREYREKGEAALENVVRAADGIYAAVVEACK